MSASWKADKDKEDTSNKVKAKSQSEGQLEAASRGNTDKDERESRIVWGAY